MTGHTIAYNVQLLTVLLLVSTMKYEHNKYTYMVNVDKILGQPESLQTPK